MSPNSRHSSFPNGHPLSGVASPYPGPRPFRREDADRFFGRWREIADLSDLVQTYRLTLLYAQSGCGKTSLLEAGLSPSLAKEGFRIISGRVGGESSLVVGNEHVFLRNLLRTFSEDDRRIASDDDIEALTALSVDEAIVRLLTMPKMVGPASEGPVSGSRTSAADELGTPVLLIVDQFEELFTTYVTDWKGRGAFLAQLAGALGRVRDLRILLAIREDFIAELDPYATNLPDGLGIRYRLERFRRPEVDEAIVRPLAALGIELDPELAAHVAKDVMVVRIAGAKDHLSVENEFAEPVHVQLACQQLWASLVASRPRHSDATIGTASTDYSFRVQGRLFSCSAAAIQGIDDALGGMYRRAVHAASRDGWIFESRLRRFFEKTFITSAGTRGAAALDSLVQAGIPQRAVAVLVEQRILYSEPRRGITWYELTHDRFIAPIRADNRAWNRERRRALAGITSVLVTVVVALLTASFFRARSNVDRVQEVVYFGSGTVLHWLRQLPTQPLQKVRLQIDVGSNAAFQTFLAANEYGQDRAGPMALFAGLAGDDTVEEVAKRFANAKIPPDTGQIYVLHLSDVPMYAWIHGEQPCSFGPRDVTPLAFTSLLQNEVARCLNEDEKVCHLFIPAKPSGTRERLKRYIQESKLEEQIREKILKVFDSEEIWGNKLERLALGDCAAKGHRCLALASFTESELPKEPGKCVKQVRLCRGDDVDSGECDPLTDPLYLLGRARPATDTLDPVDCAFIGAVAEGIGKTTHDLFTKANCKLQGRTLANEVLQLFELPGASVPERGVEPISEQR